LRPGYAVRRMYRLHELDKFNRFRAMNRKVR
jgi:hypothetical protein